MFLCKLHYKLLGLKGLAHQQYLTHPSLHTTPNIMCLAHRKFSSMYVCSLEWKEPRDTFSHHTATYLNISNKCLKMHLFSPVGSLVPWQPNWFDLEVCLRSWRLFLLPAAIKTRHWDTFLKGCCSHLSIFEWVEPFTLHPVTWFLPGLHHLHLSPCYWWVILNPVIMMSENHQW